MSWAFWRLISPIESLCNFHPPSLCVWASYFEHVLRISGFCYFDICNMLRLAKSKKPNQSGNIVRGLRKGRPLGGVRKRGSFGGYTIYRVYSPWLSGKTFFVYEYFWGPSCFGFCRCCFLFTTNTCSIHWCAQGGGWKDDRTFHSKNLCNAGGYHKTLYRSVCLLCAAKEGYFPFCILSIFRHFANFYFSCHFYFLPLIFFVPFDVIAGANKWSQHYFIYGFCY